MNDYLTGNHRKSPTCRLSAVFCLLFTIHCLLFLGAPAADPLPKLMTVLPSASPAVSDDALATYFNPASLGFRKSFNLHYLRTYDGPSSRDDALFLAGWGSTFSMEFAKAEGIPFNRYTLGDGFRLSDHFFLGSSYSWYTSDDPDYDELSLWQIGGLYRRKYLSVGGVARNVNRPGFRGDPIPRQYDLGIAIRPATNRFTLSMDVRKQEKLPGWDLSWALEVRPVRGLFVRGSIHENKSFDIHLGWNLAQLGFSGYNRFDDNQHHQDGVLQFSYSIPPYTTRPRKRIVLEITPSQIAPVLSRAKKDKNVAGAILKLDHSKLGLGSAQEARDAILDFKASGKSLISYARHYTTGTYMLASPSDRILVHPSGEVRLIGIRAEALFARELLDKLGVRANIEHIGKYKSAAEQLTRNDMSDAFREAEDAVLDDLYDQLVCLIAEGRGWSATEVQERIDNGPYSAQDALLEGLVDRLVYEDEIKTMAHELLGEKYTLVEASDYVKRRLYQYSWKGPEPRIALIHAEGMMTTGNSFRDFITGTRIMGSDTIAEAIQQARSDPRTKAIVLRIDSGGGLVLASDIIWRELMITRDQKPIIVSMGDVAASGGYYIAVPAHRIIAEPGTITGSIGVISGKYGLRDLYDKIGVHKTILKRGARADFYSDYGDYPADEQAIVKRQVQQIYRDFVQKVAEGRKMSFDEIHQVAQGRIWTGRQALERGLVDELGGMSLAIQRAKEEAGLTPDTRVEFTILPRAHWFDRLFDQLTSNIAPRVKTTWGRLASNESRLWAITPYRIEIGD